MEVHAPQRPDTVASSHSAADQGSESAFGPDALDRFPGFWALVGYSILFGVALALVSLAFLGLVKGGTNLWFTLPKNPDWLSGKPWWLAVTAGAGLLVGALRVLLRVPEKMGGTIAALREARVEPTTVFRAVAVSLVSLVGGASLGPEAALGEMGGGFGTWISARRKLDEKTSATNTLSAIGASFGGMLSSPVLATSLVVEVARPRLERLSAVLFAVLLSSTVAFAVYYPIAGSTFLGVYRLPPFAYKDWQLAAAIPLGLVAGALALTTIVAIGLLKKLTAPLAERTILRSTLGGIAFGLLGIALPLTMFTGTDQLTDVIHDGAALGAGLIIAMVFAKILAFAICESTGFIGGPILVLLFIGGTAGIATHLVVPGIPEGLAFATMFAAILGSIMSAPFTLIVLAAITTQIGALQITPVAVAVLTAYLAVSGSGALAALMRRAQTSTQSSHNTQVGPKEGSDE